MVNGSIIHILLHVFFKERKDTKKLPASHCKSSFLSIFAAEMWRDLTACNHLKKC